MFYDFKYLGSTRASIEHDVNLIFDANPRLLVFDAEPRFSFSEKKRA